MVIPGYLAVLFLGLGTALLQGYPPLGFIQGGTVNWVLASLALFLGQLALVPTVFIPSGKVFDTALTQARAAGKVTSELSAAFRNRTVELAHRAEFAIVAVIVCLMVLKPF